MAGADGGGAGVSIGTAGGVTFSSELSVVLSWPTLFSTGASDSGVLWKTHACSLDSGEPAEQNATTAASPKSQHATRTKDVKVDSV